MNAYFEFTINEIVFMIGYFEFINAIVSMIGYFEFINAIVSMVGILWIYQCNRIYDWLRLNLLTKSTISYFEFINEIGFTIGYFEFINKIGFMIGYFEFINEIGFTIGYFEFINEIYDWLLWIYWRNRISAAFRIRCIWVHDRLKHRSVRRRWKTNYPNPGNKTDTYAPPTHPHLYHANTLLFRNSAWYCGSLPYDTADSDSSIYISREAMK